ncbi:isocitrate lyase/PEP mutase family protein [Roseomonas sp. BN140053]|uniref:isocitrate lyase/PEP mutase family protein n=1 Tax=Roseomonas sp. BN140053 TaxID=3391898 RepID=UPI0039EBAAF6
MESLRSLLDRPELLVAPVALNPIMARLAEQAGFKSLYLSGGSLGWLKCVTEANLTLTEMVDVALEMRSASALPIILDAGGGWGDPVHLHRTVALSEAAGIQAIEIEDQLLPRRVHHHVGIEHLVPTEFMVNRIREAVAARRNPDFLVIGRTNARRVHDLDETLRRGEAFKKAGADMLFLYTRNPDDLRIIGERLPAPLMLFAPEEGFAEFALSAADLAGLGYRVAASPGSVFAAMFKAMRLAYRHLADGTPDPFLGAKEASREMKAAQAVTGLERLLEIEKRTMPDH